VDHTAGVDLFDLKRPEHIEDEAWKAIEAGLARLESATQIEDLHEVIGKSKELVESVARVAIEATDGTVGSAADFGEVVTVAHKQLRRGVGQDTSQDENLRALSNAARSMVTRIAPLRNAFGTGHGRASIPPVAQEMADVVLEGALLWCRWALRRLGHLLANYPLDVITAVSSGTPEKELQRKFVAATLAQQDSETQRSIGVAFGRQAAGGFGNASSVGVDPVINTSEPEREQEYPTPYRHGVIEGMLFTSGGEIGLTDFYAGRVGNLIATLPDSAGTHQFLAELTETASSATWPTHWRRTTLVDPVKTVEMLSFIGGLTPVHLRAGVEKLCAALSSAAK
jgi:hypothetical protein